MEKKLTDICKIQYGYAFDSAKFSDNEGTPLIRIRDVVRGFSETYTTEECGAEYIVKNGDMLIGMDGEFNIAHWAGGKAYLNQRVCKLIPTNDIDALYLYYFMPKALKAIEDKTPFVTVKHLSAKELNKVVVPMPTMEEQKKIAGSLQKVDELITLRKEQLAKLDQLVKSRFIELMDSTELSEEVTVEQITERVKVGFVGTCEKYYTDAPGIPMLRTGNITDHGIDMSDLKYVTLEFHDKNRKSQIRSGDLLIARHGSNGQANVYDGPEAQCLNAVVIVPNQTVAKSVFLAGLINSPKVKEQIDRTLVGSTQHVVNTKSIANLVVRIPCLEVQEQYEAFVEQTDKSKLAIQQSLDKLETLKKSMMQEYFG